MAIWDFSEYDKDDLDKIMDACITLENAGMPQDEDMLAELRSEIAERAEAEDETI